MARYLIALDFDNTLFETFKPSPNGISVQRAYQLSLRDILGVTVPINFNSAPSEIIRDILTSSDGHRDLLLERAKNFQMQTVGENSYPAWNLNPEAAITEMLVQRKLYYLLSEIGKVDQEGKIWPQPCDGALNFLDTARNLQEESVPIDLGIISSGHEAFIRKTFEVWRRKTPEVLVTEDDIRSRRYPRETERRFKPGQLSLALAHYKWLTAQNPIQDDGTFVDRALDTKKRILYIGDDTNKDLLMGQKGEVESFLYPEVSFETITQNLVENRLFFDGRPIYDITLDSPSRILAEVGLRPYEKR